MKKSTKTHKPTITDYQHFTTIDTPKRVRNKLGVGDIWSNQIHCKICGDWPRSKNRHDMSYCKCGACFVDGGSHYVRVGGLDTNAYEIMTIYYNDVKR